MGSAMGTRLAIWQSRYSEVPDITMSGAGLAYCPKLDECAKGKTRYRVLTVLALHDVGADGSRGVGAADLLVAEVKVGEHREVGVAQGVARGDFVDARAKAAQQFAIDDQLALDVARLIGIQRAHGCVVDESSVVVAVGAGPDAGEVAVGVIVAVGGAGLEVGTAAVYALFLVAFVTRLGTGVVFGVLGAVVVGEMVVSEITGRVVRVVADVVLQGADRTSGGVLREGCAQRCRVEPRAPRRCRCVFKNTQ
jgi:hypothetical protein